MTRLLPPVLVLVLALLPAAVAWPLDGGLLLAWLGSGMLAASLILMVRQPVFARWFGGLERMYRWHHVLGTLGYGLLLAHPLALAWQSLGNDPRAAWSALAPLGQSWGVALGWLSLLGLMVGLGSSYVGRPPYRWWRLLHSLLAVAVALGLAHLLAVGGLSGSAWLVLVPAVLALGWRALAVDWGGAARPYEVQAVEHPAPRVTEATLRPLGRPLAVTPGQFVMVAFFAGPRFRGCGEYHPYTVSAVRPDGMLTVTVKALGDCTRHVQSLEPGVAARVQGPYDDFLLHRGDAPELWIAGGIGITPFLAVLRAAPVTRPLELFYLYRSPETAVHLAELADHAAGQPLLRLHPLLLQDDPAQLLALLQQIPDLPARQIYLCGPPPLIAALGAWLRQQSIPAAQIHFERLDFRP